MYKYEDENLSFDERAMDLASHMTLEEKVYQTIHGAPAIERLGVKSYNWWSEALARCGAEPARCDGISTGNRSGGNI